MAYYSAATVGAGMFFLGPHLHGAREMADKRLLVTFGGLALLLISAYFVAGYSYLNRDPASLKPAD
jgi:hypothetical protein